MPVQQEDHLVTLSHPSGAKAIVHLMGALVVSWVASDGVERLYTSELTPWTNEYPIPRGGIPICYPQFGRRPTPEQIADDPLLQPLDDARNTQHGFAKSLRWQVDDMSEDSVRFSLPSSAIEIPLPLTTVHYTVRIDAKSLTTSLSIHNQSDKAWKIRPGLHPYFKLRRDQVRVEGLEEGLEWEGGTQGGAQEIWSGGDVTWNPHIGSRARSWLTPNGHNLIVHDGTSSFKMRYSGFTDVTFWNTGTEAGTFARGEDFGDMRSDDDGRFICIEPSFRNAWQDLAAGQRCDASMILQAVG